VLGPSLERRRQPTTLEPSSDELATVGPQPGRRCRHRGSRRLDHVLEPVRGAHARLDRRPSVGQASKLCDRLERLSATLVEMVRVIPDTNMLYKGGYHLKARTWPMVLAAVSFPRSGGRVGCGDHAAVAVS
jgi:hypothetical protein